MKQLFIAAPAVAARLGLDSATAFLSRRTRLEEETLFPPPMPQSRRPLLWKADEVQAWVDRHGVTPEAGIDPALIASGKVALLRMARSA